MTRTTDDLADGDRFQPLGHPIPKPASEPKPEWWPRPGSPGILENAEGKVKTDLPEPFRPPASFP